MPRAKSLAILRRAAVSPAAACFRASQAAARGSSRASRSASSRSSAASWASVAARRSASSSGVQWNRDGQPPVHGQAGLDVLEPRRVIVPAFAQVAEAEGDLASLVGQPFEGRGGLG